MRVLALLLGVALGAVMFSQSALAANPMESLLKKQIAEQRYEKMAAKKEKQTRAHRKKKRAQAAQKTKRRVRRYKKPPYRIILISGIGKKLTAHLQVSPTAVATIVRVGDRVDHEGMTFKVVLINERCIVLKRGTRRYEIPFASP